MVIQKKKTFYYYIRSVKESSKFNKSKIISQNSLESPVKELSFCTNIFTFDTRRLRKILIYISK